MNIQNRKEIEKKLLLNILARSISYCAHTPAHTIPKVSFLTTNDIGMYIFMYVCIYLWDRRWINVWNVIVSISSRWVANCQIIVSMYFCERLVVRACEMGFVWCFKGAIKS